MKNKELSDFEWLLSDEAGALMEEVSAQQWSLTTALSKLRNSISAVRASLVVEQIELRHRARRKFTDASRMFFTRRGLEQATGEHVARYKALRFPNHVAVGDYCCGIGGDLRELIRRTTNVSAVDADPFARLLAAANCRHIAGASVRLRLSDVADEHVEAVSCWHIDPDRRAEGRRTVTLENFSPNLHVLQTLIRRNPHVAIKLAPATTVPDAWKSAAEQEWIGDQRECKQLVVWHGQLAQCPGQAKATVVDSSGTYHSLIGARDQSTATVDKLGCYLHEPHPTVLAAHLTGELASRLGLRAISPGSAYLTSDQLFAGPLCSTFETLDVLAFDLHRLQKMIRSRGIAYLEIKKRGVDIDVEWIRKKLKTSPKTRQPRWTPPKTESVAGLSHGAVGEETLTLFFTPIGGRVKAVLARRVLGD